MEIAIVILFIVGTIAIVGCIFLFRNQIKWYKEGKLIYGTVIECYLSNDTHQPAYNTDTYTVMFKYEIDGQEYNDKFLNGGFRIKKGKKIPLLYKSDKPEETIYRTPVRTFFGIAITIAIGIGCFIGAFSLIASL